MKNTILIYLFFISQMVFSQDLDSIYFSVEHRNVSNHQIILVLKSDCTFSLLHDLRTTVRYGEGSYLVEGDRLFLDFPDDINLMRPILPDTILFVKKRRITYGTTILISASKEWKFCPSESCFD